MLLLKFEIEQQNRRIKTYFKQFCESELFIFILLIKQNIVFNQNILNTILKLFNNQAANAQRHVS